MVMTLLASLSFTVLGKGESLVSAQSLQQPVLARDSFYPRWSEIDLVRLVADARREALAAKARFAPIADLREQEMSFENTFGLLESHDHRFADLAQLTFALTMVRDGQEVRDCFNQIAQISTVHMMWVSEQKQVWDKLQLAAQQPWVAQLSEGRRKYIRDILLVYKRLGGQLSAERKARFNAITARLAQLTEQYSRNIIDSQREGRVELHHAWQLLGMDRGWIAEQKQESGWSFSLDSQELWSLLHYCYVESTRRLVWEKLNEVASRPPYDNGPIIDEILRLRQEQAELLGYESYADVVAESAMLDTGDKAVAFVNELYRARLPQWEEEQKKFLAFVSELRRTPTTEIQAWDKLFFQGRYLAQQKKTRSVSSYGYLSLGHVLQGVFAIYETLFGVRIATEKGEVELWHPDVRAYTIHDAESGEHLGSFYLDLFARQGKRSGAWATRIRTGQSSPKRVAHLSLVQCNFSPEKLDSDYVLYPSNVISLLHELAHVMQMTLGDVELKAHQNCGSMMDYVELPSQLMEYWGKDARIFQSLTKHHQTGEIMPLEDVKKLLASRDGKDIWQQMLQLSIAKLDLAMHHQYKELFLGKDRDAVCATILAQGKPPLAQTSPYTQNTLNHIFHSAYAGMYYSYDRTALLAADAFTCFKQEGLLHAPLGRAFREKIFARGASRDPAQQYRDFMGRDPKIDALIQRESAAE